MIITTSRRLLTTGTAVLLGSLTLLATTATIGRSEATIRLAQNTYPARFTNAFMEGCKRRAMEEGAPEAIAESYCSCSLQELQKRYTLNQLATLFQQAGETGEKPQGLVDVAQACRQQVFNQ